METKQDALEESDEIQKRFDAFCKVVIRNCVKNQLKGYLRYCSHYKLVSFDEWQEFLGEMKDEYLAEKIEVKAGRESIFLESCQLAEAMETLPERKKAVLLLAVALNYSIGEVAQELNISKKTAVNYKYQAIRELRQEVEKYGREEK